MKPAEGNKMIQEFKQELFSAWKYLFVIQLVIGGHAVYVLAAEYPDIGFIQYAIMLVLGAALIATVLLAIIIIIGSLIGASILGVQIWRDRKRESSNDSS